MDRESRQEEKTSENRFKDYRLVSTGGKLAVSRRWLREWSDVFCFLLFLLFFFRWKSASDLLWHTFSPREQFWESTRWAHGETHTIWANLKWVKIKYRRDYSLRGNNSNLCATCWIWKLNYSVWINFTRRWEVCFFGGIRSDPQEVEEKANWIDNMARKKMMSRVKLLNFTWSIMICVLWQVKVSLITIIELASIVAN